MAAQINKANYLHYLQWVCNGRWCNVKHICIVNLLSKPYSQDLLFNTFYIFGDAYYTTKLDTLK